MRRTSFLLLFVILIVAPDRSVISESETAAPCKVGSQAAPLGFWNWPVKSTVKVYVVKSEFTSTQVAFLMLPFANWNGVSDKTGSFVRFSYQGAVPKPVYCENCLTITRGDIFNKSTRHATELSAYSARGDQVLTWATIIVERALINPKVLTNAITHELGHSFGLLDCYNCRAKSTVMLKLRTLETPNGVEGPTDCDIAQVRAAYKELAVRVRPAPVSLEDEGEEPVEDDTPVVIKKP